MTEVSLSPPTSWHYIYGNHIKKFPDYPSRLDI